MVFLTAKTLTSDNRQVYFQKIKNEKKTRYIPLKEQQKVNESSGFRYAWDGEYLTELTDREIKDFPQGICLIGI